MKTTAFAATVASFGEHAVGRLTQHHVANGGVSRFEKFTWFFSEVLDRRAEPGETEALLERFGTICRDELRRCTVEPHAVGLLGQLRDRHVQLHVVSGGLQEEVDDVLHHHGLASWFSSINGSPRTKEQILTTFSGPAGSGAQGVFVGDSRYDMDVAAQFGLRRVLVTQWSEFEDWPDYVRRHPDVIVVPNLGRLSELVTSLDSEP